jgi:hypothetical protein
MANDKINQNENILVRVDQQNIIHIDPNSVVDSNGQIQPRLVDAENLVMYLNLEADLVPRTTFYANNQENPLTSVAQGTFNLLRNQGDKNKFENNFDTNWTETFVSNNNIGRNNTTGGNTIYDPTAQTFGIESVSIVVKGANNIPQISINFVDVRGKTLFESPENSPYKAFFHQPWPIFYLTVKGYYGKAIRYRIQLVDFKSKFNGSNGNFEITTKFVGSTYAFLNDILFQNAVNAPFMYMVEKQDEPLRVNEKTGFIEKKISKTTKGYSILTSIYNDYKAKGYIDKDFPVKTLRDLLMTAKGLDKIIETQLFSETVDPGVLTDVAEYDTLLDSFERSVQSWANRNLNSQETEIKSEKLIGPDGTEKTYRYYRIKKAVNDQTKTTTGTANPDIITSKDNKLSLQSLINNFIEKAENNTAFGNKIKVTQGKNALKTTTISIDKVRNINSFFTFDGAVYGVAIEKLVDAIKSIQTTFITSRNDVEKGIEDRMNVIISSKDPNLGGFGFKPTIRNIFAVILANADTYIRLMKDVHSKAIQKANERKAGLVKPTDGNKNEFFYPWPEVLRKQNNETNVSLYPADPAIVKETKADNFSLWPEIEFIETYNSVATKRVDPLGKEISSSDLAFVFDNDSDKRNIKNISSLFKINDTIPYTNKSFSNLLYEIYERAFFTTSYNSFTYGSGLDSIVDNEVENLKGSLTYDVDIIELIKNSIKTTDNLILKMGQIKERVPFFQNKLSTVDYIKGLVDSDFEILDFKETENNTSSDTTTNNLQNAINDYKIDAYRLNEFPFNSALYYAYLGKEKISEADYKYKNILTPGKDNSFISSPINPQAWVHKDFTKNIFSRKLKFLQITFDGEILDSFENLLNTPYFHKQLYDDFFKGGITDRYAGSAYLLLNSLPYKDMDDLIDFNGTQILMSSLFKEIGASHFIPYHLMLKWGSQYHRYKKYLKEGVDIISGATIPINGSVFFDNGTNTTFNLSGITPSMSGVTRNSNEYIGLYPYYSSIFHQIVNGYSFYNPSGFTSGSGLPGTPTSSAVAAELFKTTITSGITKYSINKSVGGLGYSISSFVDNSKFEKDDKRYTILPSSQINESAIDIGVNFNSFESNSLKLIFNDTVGLIELTPYDIIYLPEYNESFKTVDGLYSLLGEQRKFFDLISVFSPKMLDEMEEMFLEFSSLDLTLDSANNIKNYNTFQGLLRAISSLPMNDIDFTKDENKKNIVKNQTKNLEEISQALLENTNLKKLTIGNPRQIDNYTLFGFAGLNNNYSVEPFNQAQVTQQNLNLIELYAGYNITGSTYSNISNNLYLNFFQVNNIALNEENIYDHRELARIYAGWVKFNRDTDAAFVPNKLTFVAYINTEIIAKQNDRLANYLDNMISKLSTLTGATENNKLTIYHGYNEAKTTKLDLYQYFKSFNDKWIAGNAIGQRYLMEEFLFLDRANRDIGNEAYISLDRLISLSDEKNIKVDLYSAISILIQGTNFDMRPLPAYVNFYGTNSTNKKKISPSKNLARNLFGTYLDVDYQDSSPKIILQYVNGVSKYLDMSRVSKEYMFKNDTFDIKDSTNNPLLIQPKIFMDADLSKSNRVVSFEVNFGDFGQGIFKEVSLDQSTYKNTTESAVAQERLARSQGGGGSHQVDIGLFDIYKTASYQCTITMMGNVMMQPTMYFYLANIPMFEGTYMIFDVSHQIRENNIQTTLTGVRLSSSMLPNLENSFMSSYRPLFSKVLSSAIKKKQYAKNQLTTEKTILLKNNENAKINPGNPAPGEDLDKIIVKENGFHKDLIPFNGVKYNGKEEQFVQYVERSANDKWLRAYVVRMGGPLYPIKDNEVMRLISGLSATPQVEKTWKDISGSFNEYYSVRVNLTRTNKEDIFKYKTQFLNPKTNATYTLQPLINSTNNTYNGPIHVGPPETIGNYGIGMNTILMKTLKLNEGDVVYFRLI